MNGEKLRKIIIRVRRYFLTICHLKIRNKKEDIVCFSERLGIDAKRRYTSGIHTKELSTKKSEITMCKRSLQSHHYNIQSPLFDIFP